MNASKRILLTGASGLIGSRLTEMLLQKGYEVSHLSRHKSNTSKVKTFVWNIESGAIEKGALDGIDTIIHLAGAGVADKRWTNSRKKEILESRTKSTALLFNELKKENAPVKNFISASAIGYYGFDNNSKLFDENDKPGSGFLAEVTSAWEAEADKIEQLGIRLVKLRIGIVLSKKGGALEPMAKAVKFLVGSPLGSGDQYMSWIHIEDLCQMFIHAVENTEVRGAFNAVAPNPVTNKEMTEAIAKQLRKPMIFPSVPAFVLKAIFGEMGDVVLKGNKVSSKKIQETRFNYKFTTLDKALKDLLA
ncbi:TIGR01777 family oxidoreductase [Chryseosolibacter indicus]|uniref:TIGR01777 family oxidoreductase n=1 Tax=Chryseosolibacter indicus TaxID=2782351 RepID=A0ABS5VU77_9BACT|nr:TIGR01777 family oxidoreductase [Chryseosolibacter indicus]MBT1704377.1 TIGR01777 family oxidoreductase [Chryseosolibacter indicus]